MANKEHLTKLHEGVEVWNAWRNENSAILPDLRGADLHEINPGTSTFRNIKVEFHPQRIDPGAKIYDLQIKGVFMSLENVSLDGSNLAGVDLSGADLSFADLSGAFLEGAMLIETNFTKAVLSRCSIFGISAWDLNLDDTIQEGLIATPHNQPVVTVDGLEVAQFIYLLLNNKKLTQVINTIGEKGVLILGRFTPERKVILDTIRERLRDRGFLPMMFDFEKPRQKDFTETIKVLAGMSRFIIADITNPKSNPLELQATVPDYMTPLVPIIHENEKPFSMFLDLQQKYEWVLDVLEYDSVENLGNYFDEAIIEPALVMADRLLMKKTQTIRTRHLDEYKRKS